MVTTSARSSTAIASKRRLNARVRSKAERSHGLSQKRALPLPATRSLSASRRDARAAAEWPGSLRRIQGRASCRRSSGNSCAANQRLDDQLVDGRSRRSGRPAEGTVRLIRRFQRSSSERYAAQPVQNVSDPATTPAARIRSEISSASDVSDTRGVSGAKAPPMKAERTATAAGVMPGIRSAWPSVSGRISSRR